MEVALSFSLFTLLLSNSMYKYFHEVRVLLYEQNVGVE